MAGKTKVIVDGENVYKVEYREGVQTCVFLAEDGCEVLFQRDKNGKVKTVKSPAEEFESYSWAVARGTAGLKLVNHFLKKGWGSTSKVVAPTPATPKAKKCPYPEADARRHEQSLMTHNPEDD